MLQSVSQWQNGKHKGEVRARSAVLPLHSTPSSIPRSSFYSNRSFGVEAFKQVERGLRAGTPLRWYVWGKQEFATFYWACTFILCWFYIANKNCHIFLNVYLTLQTVVCYVLCLAHKRGEVKYLKTRYIKFKVDIFH